MRGPALVLMLVLVLVLPATGCAPPPPSAVDAAPRRAMRLAGVERRDAISPRRSRDAVRFAVPSGAKTATLGLAAWSTGRLAWFRRGEESCEIRSLPSGAALSIDVPRAASAGKARWIAADVACAGDSEIEVRCPASPPQAEAWFTLSRFAGAARPGRNVLMISLDTVRADAPGRSTPALDALAAQSVRFRRAYSAAPWTLPSHVSVMTGLLPSWHGRWDPKTRDHDLPAIPTLAAVLSDAGWDTAAFTGQGSISWALGATRGFRLVVEEPPTSGDGPKECDLSSERVAAWLLARRPGDPPFLLFWHTYEAHAPYTDDRFDDATLPLPPGIAEDARRDWQRYLGDLASADEALAVVLAALEASGLRPSTDVVLFSDHGEDFGEHSGGRREESTRHGNGLWDTQLHVPLLVRSPALAPGDRDDLVSLVDLFPTVLELAGAPPRPSQGRTLLRPTGRDAIAAESLYPDYAPHEQKCRREASGLKLITTLASPPTEQLLDAASDPLELRDVAAERPDDARRLREAAAVLWSSAPMGTSVRVGHAEGAQVPPELLESLKTLGYVR